MISASNHLPILKSKATRSEKMSYCGSWITPDRHYSFDYDTFTKRELLPHERQTNLKGEIIRLPWSTERPENEYGALEYIAANTDIPVPEVLSFENIGGSFHLVVERVSAIPIYQMREDQAEALKNAKNFITTLVLPQLADLKSTRIGNLNGVVIPPVRISDKDKWRWWPPRISSTQEFVVCHNDLAQHNIMIDPDTWKLQQSSTGSTLASIHRSSKRRYGQKVPGSRVIMTSTLTK